MPYQPIPIMLTDKKSALSGLSSLVVVHLYGLM
jgi:hypothetical protein